MQEGIKMSVSKKIKNRNYGYLCGVFMFIIFAAITALIIFLSLEDINAAMSSIFARDSFFSVAKGLFSFIGDFRSKLHFGKGMNTLFYVDAFCLVSAILGFVQGALHNKRDLIS